jgi:hypothetical protein
MKRFAGVLAVVALVAAAVGSSSAGAKPSSRPRPTTTTTRPPIFTIPAQAPAAPTNLRLFGTPTSTSFSVIVNPATGPGTSGYYFYLNGVRVGATCSGQSYCFDDYFLSGKYSGLTPGTTYTATATAYLFALPAITGVSSPQILESSPSAPFVFTTPLA